MNTRFAMDEPVLRSIPGAFGFRCSNPPVICVAALLASVEIFDEAGIDNLRAKSKVLTVTFHIWKVGNVRHIWKWE